MSILKWLFGYSKAERQRGQRIEADVAASAVRESPEDLRDYVFVPRVEPTEDRLTALNVVSIENQGRVGQCVGEAVVCAAEAVWNTYGTRETEEYSAPFVYKLARRYDNLVGDSGAHLRSGLRVAKNYGMLPESSWPRSNDPAVWDREPTEEMYAQAALKRGMRYELIEQDIDNFRVATRGVMSALAEGLPVAMVFAVRRWMVYVSGPMGSKGHNIPYPMPAGGNDIIGLHAVCIVGYDRTMHVEQGGSLIVVNSWGTSWGDGGRWSLPLFVFEQPGFLREVRAIRSFAGVEAAPVPPEPLTLAQVRTLREELASLDLGSIDEAGNFRFAPGQLLPYLAAWRLLEKRGCSYADASQVVGVGADSIESFVTSHAPKVDAWNVLM